jgi:hypothetical protein
MRRRLYFLLPNVPRARQVVDELLLARIDDHHIHVMAREGTPLGDLPKANLLQRSDFVHGMEIGLSVGGATGIIAGLVAIAFPPEGLALGGLGRGGVVHGGSLRILRVGGHIAAPPALGNDLRDPRRRINLCVNR